MIGEKMILPSVAMKPPSKGDIRGVLNETGFAIPNATSTPVTMVSKTNTPQILVVTDLNLINPLNIAKLCASAMFDQIIFY
jgi:hypothetical protein